MLYSVIQQTRIFCGVQALRKGPTSRRLRNFCSWYTGL